MSFSRPLHIERMRPSSPLSAECYGYDLRQVLMAAQAVCDIIMRNERSSLGSAHWRGVFDGVALTGCQAAGGGAVRQ